MSPLDTREGPWSSPYEGRVLRPLGQTAIKQTKRVDLRLRALANAADDARHSTEE
jgi:hypothetical protein